MKDLYSIGEVSKIKDLTVKALRYYQRMGILEPKFIDENNGYRYYSLEQFIYIDIIKVCRGLGTSIEELQRIFTQCDTDKLMEVLKEKQREAEKTIEKMREVIKTIDDIGGRIEHSKKILASEEICEEIIEDRYIISVPYSPVNGENELLYYPELTKKIEKSRVKTTLERGRIYSIDDGEDTKLLKTFNVVDKSEVKDNSSFEIIPGGKYLTINYNKENEKNQIKKILNYIEEHSINIKCFLEVDLINDIFNTENYNCQIQILT